MKQKTIKTKLIDFSGTDQPFGNIEGKATFRKLSEFVDSHPHCEVFGISLEGIKNTDISFPRESVLSIAKLNRGQKGFYLEGMNPNDRDLFDNWQGAAAAKDQPLVIWHENSYEIIGPETSTSSLELINYVLKNKIVTTSKVAMDLEITVHNASTKLKKLVEQGYIMRSEDVAESGGIEFIYHAIK